MELLQKFPGVLFIRVKKIQFYNNMYCILILIGQTTFMLLIRLCFILSFAVIDSPYQCLREDFNIILVFLYYYDLEEYVCALYLIFF